MLIHPKDDPLDEPIKTKVVNIMGKGDMPRPGSYHKNTRITGNVFLVIRQKPERKHQLMLSLKHIKIRQNMIEISLKKHSFYGRSVKTL